MSATEAAAVRERLAFARRALVDAQNTYALVRQTRIDAMGQGLHAEHRAMLVIEENLARRRVGEWDARLRSLEHSARFLGVEL